MSAASRGLIIAGDLFVACLILSVGMIVGRMSNKMSQTSATVINQNTVAYTEADISSLLASEHSGTAVKNYVTKYRRSMVVEVMTKAASLAGQDALSIDATTSTSDLTDEDSVYFIKNDAVFSCEGDKDTNGNYIRLRFAQKWSGNGPIIDTGVTNADTARQFFISLLNGNDNMDWKDISEQVKELVSESSSAKENLVSDINKFTQSQIVSTDSTWHDIYSQVDSMFNSYQNSLNGILYSTQHHRQAFALSASSQKVLDFAPTTLIVTNDATNKVSIWTSDSGTGWVTDSPAIGVAGNTISNTDSEKTFSIVAYN